MKHPHSNPSVMYFEQPIRLMPRDIAVLIPAYKPSEGVIDVVDRLSDAGVSTVILVDDGSPERFQALFDLLGQNPRVHLLRHPSNLGRGAALKTGIRYFIEHLGHYKGLVTADADGQHAPDDIIRIARALNRSPRLAIVGARAFTFPLLPEHPPLRSVFGNRITSALFRWTTRVPLTDAQSGLRALPASTLPGLLELPGMRYEFEMLALMHLARTRQPLAEQPIRTLYDPKNPTSNFRPIRDSLRVLRALFSRALPFSLSASELPSPGGSAEAASPQSSPSSAARAK
jgi:glycosyltransferase involved in cell wall biosynthesis